MWIQQAFWVCVIIGAVLWFFAPYLSPIGGKWYESESDGRPWELMQIGRWVFGEQRQEGGVRRFSGHFKKGCWYLKRRDDGPALFQQQGFPAFVAHQLSGRVMVTYQLKCDAQAKALTGQMTPIKVIFLKDPPRVSSLVPESPQAFVLTKNQPM